ncbi:glycoside hydrolase family 5 protein [Sphaerobolus stellatus SS14]|nr:glycoside hydrolase family 5 protein [Sphaerobolus stellatus SS14]
MLDHDSNRRYANEKPAYTEKGLPRRKNRTLVILGTLAAIVVVVLAVFLPVYFTIIKPRQNRNLSSSSSSSDTGSDSGSGSSGSAQQPGSGGSTGKPSSLAITGGDGSVVTASDGSTFKYQNSFGGYWYQDPTDPYKYAARAQSFVPALNETWNYGPDKIRGVNLGGWFVLEPFISPALYEKYQTPPNQATDEWSLSEAMRADTSAGGGISQIEKHYQTFITEEDFAQIAAAGLAWIRLPIPYWAINTWPGEPFLERVSWKYILQAFEWARKYGLRIYLDLHTAPGNFVSSYNHSGKFGQVNLLNGVMGLANAERMLGYIRTITEFISQPQYVNLIPIFGVLNEPLLTTMGRSTLDSFNLEAHNLVRSITGFGEGKGPYIAIGDGFAGIGSWAGFLPNSDRVILDTHPYFAFDGSPNTQPLSDFDLMPCTGWANGMNESQTAFGLTLAGEFSNAVNDCGLYVRGVGGPAAYGGDCSFWEDATLWNSSTIDGLKKFAMSSMDSLQNYFFWTWKIGNSTTTNSVRAPLWTYQLGLEIGAIPKDPREAIGACSSLGAPLTEPFDGTYSAWQTGGVGAGSIAADASVQFPWPPLTIANIELTNAVSLLPTYTNTVTPAITLPTPTLTFTTKGSVKTVSAGNGWANQNDNAGDPTTVAGCTYPDPWDATSATMPTAPCPNTVGAQIPVITPPPTRR